MVTHKRHAGNVHSRSRAGRPQITLDDHDLLAARLASWRHTPVATITRADLTAAQAASPDAGPLFRAAGKHMRALCDQYDLEPDAAQRAFGTDILAALTVAAHQHQPGILAEQVAHIRFFLSHRPVRNRLARDHPHPPAPEGPEGPHGNPVQLNSDGSAVYADGTVLSPDGRLAQRRVSA